MTDYLADIRDFHTKFEQSYEGPPRFLDEEQQAFRANFKDEEIEELCEAWLNQDLPKALDALVDLLYVLMGTVYLMGLSPVFAEAWRRVHAANMQKVLAPSASASKRGYAGDVVKPPGWTPPDLSDLVA